MTTTDKISELIEDMQSAKERAVIKGDKQTAAVLHRAAMTIIAMQEERLKFSGVLASMLLERKNNGEGRRSDWNKPCPGRSGNNRNRPKKNMLHTTGKGA